MFGRTGRNWQQRREVTVDLQSRLAHMVESWDGVVPTGVSIHGVSDQRRFVAESSIRPLVSMDYPAVKSGSAASREYLRESEWSKDGRTILRVDSIEKSSMWSSLVGQYSQGLGKLRVYVHPEFASLVQAAVTRDNMQGAVWGALAEVRV